MKVAEALAERADLDKALSALTHRLPLVARYAEGEQPAESAPDLVREMKQLVMTRQGLATRINQTNAVTSLEDGTTITAALARRDRLAAERKFLTDAADAAGPGRDPYSFRGRRRAELPEKTDLPVQELRREANQVARAYRELDLKIQESNWATELL